MVDTHGFVWFGSEDGLERWDGYRIRRYEPRRDDVYSLPDDFVRSLAIGPDGQLWVGTNSNGIARYNPRLDVFNRFRSPLHLGIAGSGSVRSIVGDGAHGLWLGTSVGLEHFDIPSGTFVDVPVDASLELPGVNAVWRDADGRLWIGTGYGLFRSQAYPQPSAIQFVRVPLAIAEPNGKGSVVTALLRDSRGSLWIGTTMGAFVLSATENLPRRVRESGPSPSSLDRQMVSAIVEVRPGLVWIGTYGQGIVAVDKATGETHRIVNNPSVEDSLGDNVVLSMYCDYAGTVWVATNTKLSRSLSNAGLETYRGESVAANPAAPPRRATSRFEDGLVAPVLSLRDGSLWLGVRTRGIAMFDAEGRWTGEIRPNLSTAGPTVTTPYVHAMAETSGGIYFSANKLYRSDSQGRRWRKVSFGERQDTNIPTLLADGDCLWVGTVEGVWCKRLDDSRASQPSAPVVRTNAQVNAMARGTGNDLWIGTGTELIRYDLVTHETERTRLDPDDPQPTKPAAPIASLLLDPSGKLWITTNGSGLWVMEGRDAKGASRFRRATATPAIPDVLGTVLSASDGTIWMMLDSGLGVYDPARSTFRALLPADGVEIMDYVFGSGTKTSAGQLIFGGAGGITIIQPELVKPWKFIPPVAVTEVVAGGRQFAPEAFNTDGTNSTIQLAPDARTLSVEFAALDYSAPEQNLYAYRLVGFDRDWIQTDATRRSASYTNLPKGQYTLELRGSNRNGVWGKTLRIPIDVLPAWYETIWARIGYVVLFVLSLVGLFRLGRMFAAARERELERQVAVRTEELRQSQLQLEELAYYDHLTGLANRRMFNVCFRRLLALSRRQKAHFTVILFDLDRFKEVNDTYGHAAGDELLKTVAGRLNPIVRDSDCFARLGGDEFGILLAEFPGDVALGSICAKIAATFAEPLRFEGKDLSVTFSIGVAVYPDDGIDEPSLLQTADEGLYAVKRSGRNGWQRFRRG